MADRRLGRGLDGLLQGQPNQPAADVILPQGPTTTIPTALLDPNPNQPRQGIAPEDLDSLAASIREHGVIQPVVVRRHADRYQIIAGERRFRAAQALGMADVPVVVRDVPDEQMLELALVENLQREDLDPIEKAQAFKAYLASSGRSQEAASARLGLDRSTLSNMIRLLELPPEVQAMVRNGLVAMGHARALVAIDDRKRQIHIAERVAREGLSVRQVERLTSSLAAGRPKRRAPAKSAEVRDLEATLRDAFGTRVSVEPGQKPGTGRIVIEFYSQDDIDRILARLG